MRARFEHEYPPGDWTHQRVRRALDAVDSSPVLPTYEDEAVWADLRSDDLTGPHVESIVADASDAREAALPSLRASDYLRFHRTGERYAYQDPMQVRLSRLSTFAVAECFEREGEFLDDVLDYAWAVCEQSSWVSPAHLRGVHDHEGLPDDVDASERVVALHSTWIGESLAEVDHLLGDQLHPALRDRIRTEVDRRIVAPYLARDDLWWLSPPAMNWNAVCNGSAALAALYALDDTERQARVVSKAAHSLGHYLADFDRDGCTAEGVIYWDYGVGHYVKLAAELAARTDGDLSLCSPPVVAEIAAFPLRIELSRDRYVPFSDSRELYRLSPAVASWLATRFDVEGLGAVGRRLLREHGTDVEASSSTSGLRALLWTREVPDHWERSMPSARRFFDGHDWWIVRNDPADPDGLVAAAKGGHNGEPHNHNDCGSFVVHYRGESLLSDLGRPTYDRDYFEDDHRYGYLAARSLGHSVPYVNGCEQAAGDERAAKVIDRETSEDRESLTVALGDCYPAAAGLASLERTVALVRGESSRVTVSDRATFEPDADRAFESVLVSYVPMEATGDAVVATGQRSRATVTPQSEAGGATVDVEKLPDAIKERDVWRARIALEADDGDGVDLTLGIDVEAR